MEQILRVFYNNGSFFTFVGLHLLCIYLIVNFNSVQGEIAAETWSVRTGAFQSFAGGITDYVDLRQINAEQRTRIAELTARLPRHQYDSALQVDSFADDRYLQRYTFLATEVVNRSPYGPNNTLVINRGRRLGVEAGQGVIADVGLVGIIDRVTENHARLISILHQSTRISAGLANNAYGTLRWDGLDPRYMTVVDLPDFITVSPGDTVFTTGFSNIFPTGQVIGTVAETAVQPGTGSQQLKVLLIGDPLRAGHGYVVRDLFKEELESLKQR